MKQHLAAQAALFISSCSSKLGEHPSCACALLVVLLWFAASPAHAQTVALLPESCSPQKINSLPTQEQRANQQTICDAIAQLIQAKQDLNQALNDAADKASKAEESLKQQAGSVNTNATTFNSQATSANQQINEATKQNASTQQDLDKTAKQAADLVSRAQTLIPKSAVPANAVPRLLGDHVPCLMDKDELYEMRGMGTGQGVENTNEVKNAIINTANSPSTLAAAKKVTPTAKDFLQKFSLQISGTDFSGLNASQVRTKTSQVATEVAKESSDDPTVAKGLADTTQAAGNAGAAVVTPTFKRPTDVGCSMSIMPWKESSKVFGRAVADAFLAVQVVIRNMDSDHEFLLHDAELAVDAYSSRVERFQVSHEKEVVRGVSVWGQAYGRHAIGVHIVEGLGILMGAVVGMPEIPDNFIQATGAYQAGLIPTFNKLFPNLDTNNLNNLNDLGFSARSNARIVVPKGGSVPFVMFIPVQPLEQACWLQDRYDFFSDDSFTTACTAIKGQDEKTYKYNYPNTDNDWLSFSKNWKTVAFKKWTPIQLQALEKHAYAAIAGQHFKAVANAATLKTITCTSLVDNKNAYYQALIKGDLTCTLTGSDFDTMAKLRLRPPSDTNDADAIDGKVTVSGDTTTATVTIAGADVKKINQPTYNLFSADKSGNETNLNSTLSFVLSPRLDDKQSINASDWKSGKVTLTGANLGQLANLSLKDSSGQLVSTANVADKSDTKVTLAPTNKDVAPKDYTVEFVLNDAAKSTYDPDPPQTVTVK